MSLHRCPKRGTPHPAHPFRMYVMGGILPATCPGEQFCPEHDRPYPCEECAND